MTDDERRACLDMLAALHDAVAVPCVPAATCADDDRRWVIDRTDT